MLYQKLVFQLPWRSKLRLLFDGSHPKKMCILYVIMLIDFGKTLLRKYIHILKQLVEYIVVIFVGIEIRISHRQSEDTPRRCELFKRRTQHCQRYYQQSRNCNVQVIKETPQVGE